MEEFVTDLIRKSDLSILTTKAVRKAYESHINRQLTQEEKKKLKELVNITLDDIAKNIKAPTKSACESEFVSLSPTKDVARVTTVSSPPSLLEEGTCQEKPQETERRSSPRKRSENKPSEPTRPVEFETTKKLPRNTSKKLPSYTELDEEIEEEKKVKTKKARVKKKSSNVKNNLDSFCDSDIKFDEEKEEDKVSDCEKYDDASRQITTTENKSKKKSKKGNVNNNEEEVNCLNEEQEKVSPTKSRPKLVLSLQKLKKKASLKSLNGSHADPTESEVDLPSVDGSQDHDNDSSKEKDISFPMGDNSVNGTASKVPKKKNSKSKKGKNLSICDALQAVMDSDVDDMLSEDPSNVTDSVSEEELFVRKKKGQKRKILSDDEYSHGSDRGDSDSLHEFVPSETTIQQKSPKKSPQKSPSPRKPRTKRRRVLSELESENDSDVGEIPAKRAHLPKKLLPKRQNVLSDEESEDSGDDRLQIDIGVSTIIPKEKENLSGLAGPGKGDAKLKKDFESESEKESVSIKSWSDKVESDVASWDSGVNVDLNSSIGKDRGESIKSQKYHRKKKKYEGKVSRNDNSGHENSLMDEDTFVQVSDENLSDEAVQRDEKRRWSPLKSLKQKYNMKSSVRDVDSETEKVQNRPSVFSLSETESDQNIVNKKRELRKAFQQRHISKLLECESFDVKQCVIVLERIDDQIDWVRKTAKFKVTSSNVSARGNFGEMDLSELGQSSVNCEKTTRKKKKRSKFHRSSTPKMQRKQQENLEEGGRSDYDDSDSYDLPLKLVKNKSKQKSSVLDSTFDSDDLPLKSFRKKRKNCSKIVNVEDSEPVSFIAKSDKSGKKSRKRIVLKIGLAAESDCGSKQSSQKRKRKNKKKKSKIVLDTSSDEDTDNEPLSKMKSNFSRKGMDADNKLELLESNSFDSTSVGTDISCEAIRSSPRKLESSVYSPTKSPHSHSASVTKSDTLDVVLESEDDSDVGSLNDSIRSLEMLKGGTEKSTKTGERSSDCDSRPHIALLGADNSDTESRMRLSSDNGESDSDVSSIIEPQATDGLSSVSGHGSGSGCSDSEVGSIASAGRIETVVDRASFPKENGSEKSADESDTDTSLDAVSETSAKKGSRKKGQTTETKENRDRSSYNLTLTELRKICRCAGIILRNSIELFGCETDNDKKLKIIEILKRKGMHGKPTMSKAETLKLKKEASELNTDNIISDSGRPQRRKVQSLYNRGGNSASPSPKKTVTPLKLRLSGLWGIVDTEGSD